MQPLGRCRMTLASALVRMALAALPVAALPLAAQDSANAPVMRGAVLRFSFGRLETATLIGRLDRSDSSIVRVMVGGDEGDPGLRAARLGLSVAETGKGDSMLIAVPWRTVRIVEVASGRRSRRAQNGLMGALIGTGIGGGVGAVMGATVAKSTCSLGSSSNCGISPSAGEGALIGGALGGLVGGIYGAIRESWTTVWTPLPERGRQLREGAIAP